MNTVQKQIVVKNHKFCLEIYPQREGTNEDQFVYEIFPHGYKAALYAFSNKQSLDKMIKEKYLYEKK